MSYINTEVGKRSKHSQPHGGSRGPSASVGRCTNRPPRLETRLAMRAGSQERRETPDRRPEEAIKAKRTHSKGALQRYWKRGSNRISWTLLSSPPYLCLRCCLQELNNAAKTSQPRSAHHLTPHVTTPNPGHARLPQLSVYRLLGRLRVIVSYTIL